MPYICLKQSGKPDTCKGLTLLDGATKVYRFLYSNTPLFLQDILSRKNIRYFAMHLRARQDAAWLC